MDSKTIRKTNPQWLGLLAFLALSHSLVGPGNRAKAQTSTEQRQAAAALAEGLFNQSDLQAVRNMKTSQVPAGAKAQIRDLATVGEGSKQHWLLQVQVTGETDLRWVSVPARTPAIQITNAQGQATDKVNEATGVEFVSPILSYADKDIAPLRTRQLAEQRGRALADKIVHGATATNRLGSSSPYCDADADPLFESCTKKQSPMGSSWSPGTPFCPTLADPQVPLACVVMAQKTFPQGQTYYARCPSPQGRPAKGAKPPCVERDYSTCVRNSFEAVQKCLGNDTKTMFGMFAHESGFHTTAMSFSGCAGVGQLSGPAIKEINNRAAEFIPSLQSSSDPQCQKYGDLLKEKKSSSPSQRCAFMVGSDNPARSFVYAGAFYKLNRQRMLKELQAPSLVDKLNRLGLTDADRNRLAEMFTILSYNAGQGGAVSMLRSLIRSAKSKSQLSVTGSDKDFLSSFIRNNYRWGGSARKKEVAGYLRKIKGKISEVENLVGKDAGRCGKPDLFTY